MIEKVAMMPLQELGEDVGDRLIEDINGILPNIVYAIVIAVLGFVAATIIGGRVAGFVNRMDVSERANDSVFGEMFLGERRRLGDLIGTFVKVYIYLLTAFLIANELQLGRVSAALNGVVEFIPTAAVALLVLGVGFWLADLVKDRIVATATEATRAWVRCSEWACRRSSTSSQCSSRSACSLARAAVPDSPFRSCRCSRSASRSRSSSRSDWGLAST